MPGVLRGELPGKLAWGSRARRELSWSSRCRGVLSGDPRPGVEASRGRRGSRVLPWCSGATRLIWELPRGPRPGGSSRVSPWNWSSSGVSSWTWSSSGVSPWTWSSSGITTWTWSSCGITPWGRGLGGGSGGRAGPPRVSRRLMVPCRSRRVGVPHVLGFARRVVS
ncbi:hypothetical protein CgunFtcFv8_012180 [Champsocephalus gunnari]|uniref:Uncharacterized protein n=1 Tax=Champsocephalus gunnari TaxID=52237 RepID=A0AAN8D9C8_CHAGU|nr:hypothetical protein CgunFtcFv8_012180 [Champsocephalus gunnari]